jgi:2-polyprenyl-3-methyl-5-hydroxy-6-metoxy-1,4-benzoquinol methylase
LGEEHLLYTELARYHDAIYREYLEHVVPRLVDAVDGVFRGYAGRSVREVLDAAYGTGGPTIELAKRGYAVRGVDLHREVVKVAREKARRAGLPTRRWPGSGAAERTGLLRGALRAPRRASI